MPADGPARFGRGARLPEGAVGTGVTEMGRARPALVEGYGGSVARRAGDGAGAQVDDETVLGENASWRRRRLCLHPGAGAVLLQVGQQLASAVGGAALDRGARLGRLNLLGPGPAGVELGRASGCALCCPGGTGC